MIPVLLYEHSVSGKQGLGTSGEVRVKCQTTQKASLSYLRISRPWSNGWRENIQMITGLFDAGDAIQQAGNRRIKISGAKTCLSVSLTYTAKR